MRKFTKAATLTLTAMGLTIGGAAFAADQAAKMPAKEAAAQALSDSYSQDQLTALAGKLIGKKVTNSTGDNIGDIEDIALGADQKPYAIVSVGQFLGTGDKSVPIHVGELGMQGDNVVLMSESSKSAIEALPEYSQDQYKSVLEDQDTQENQ